MNLDGQRRPSGPVQVRPTVASGRSKRFLREAGLRWEDGHLTAVDADGRAHPCPEARCVVLQTDLQVGVRSIHGAHDLLLVLDGEGQVLTSAPKGPFDPLEVEAFCRAHGLDLRHTERAREQPAMPPKASSYTCLDVTRRTSIIVNVAMIATVVAAVVAGITGLFHPLAVLGVGAVVSFVLLIVLS